MVFIKKVFLAWRASGYWVEALHQYRRGKHVTALKLLEKFSTCRPLLARHYILQGVLFFYLEKTSESITALQHAFENIEKDKRLNLDEKKYLSTYIIYFLERINSGRDLGVNVLSEPLVDYNFDIKNVRQQFLDAFPM